MKMTGKKVASPRGPSISIRLIGPGPSSQNLAFFCHQSSSP
jgi:hypothetical protein